MKHILLTRFQKIRSQCNLSLIHILDETVVLQPVKAFFTPKAGGDAVEAEVKTQEDELLDIQIPCLLYTSRCV